MEYKVADIEDVFNTEIVQKLSDSEYIIKINGNETNLKVLNMNSQGIEFILDKKYHSVQYLENTTSSMKVLVDNVPITLKMHHQFDEIVYKNTGGGGTGSAQLALKSQIPGKVVSIAVADGDSVKKGDVVCTLESMKMQVSVKAHKDGVVKLIKVKETGTVAKGDIIAEIE